MSKQIDIQQAEWIVKTYNNYQKEICRNDTVNLWVYEQKLILIEEANRLRDLSLYGVKKTYESELKPRFDSEEN